MHVVITEIAVLSSLLLLESKLAASTKAHIMANTLWPIYSKTDSGSRLLGYFLCLEYLVLKCLNEVKVHLKCFVE